MMIEKQVFGKPSGNIRGVVTLQMTFGKKRVRVGHAYLMVGAPAEITVGKMPAKLTVEDVGRISEALKSFAIEVSGA